MAGPARTGTAGPVRRIAAGPRAPGWGAVRRAMVTGARDGALALDRLRAAPADSRALAAAEALVKVLRELRELARYLDVGEAVIEAECARSVQEDRAARPAARRRGRGDLRAVP